jgi:lipopolysaccharide export system protein LptA
MREKGREIERVEAPSPVVAEFLPNRPGQKRRKLTGERLTVRYGKQNHAETLESINVTTRTESEPRRKGDSPVVSTTRSKGLVANFDPKTGELARLEQWDGFQYEEGARRATAVHAYLDQATEVITLDQQARVWDDTGSTAADKIILEQKSGVMTAAGNVASTRLPDKKAASGGMLEGDAPLQAHAAGMTSSDRNRKLRYQGGAVVWQGARRIAAESIDIDRGEGTLQAQGGVMSTFPDAANGTAGQKAPATLTTIHAQRLNYSDKAKTAHYSGDAVLERPNLEVRSRELRLFFREEPNGQSKETKLDRLLAEGKVDLRQRTASRTAVGGAERMEYFLGDEHGELSGGTPFLNDSQRGITRGERITWYSRSDRLMVDNRGVGPAVSRLKKK